MEKLKKSKKLLQSSLDALSAYIAILDGSGNIISTNKAWRQFKDHNNLFGPEHKVGENYFEIFDSSEKDFGEDISDIIDGIKEVMLRNREEYYGEYSVMSLI